MFTLFTIALIVPVSVTVAPLSEYDVYIVAISFVSPTRDYK